MSTRKGVRRVGLAVLVASFTLGTLGAGPAGGQDADIRFIKVAEVQRMLRQGGKLLLVDVRTNQEFLARHIKGAVSIPLNAIEQRQGEFPRQGLVVLY